MSYAIKKLAFSSVGERSECEREVEIMAKINHVNIVNYKNSWIEPPAENQEPHSEEKFYESQNSSDASYGSNIVSIFR